MAGLVGIAFTSPAIAVTVIDRDKFRVHFYKNDPSSLHAFLQDEDSRLPIVLLSSIQALKRVEKVKGVHAFLLAEDPRALFELKGAIVLDAEVDPSLGYRKISISSDDINSSLASPGEFEFTPAAITALGELSSDILFKELSTAFLSYEGISEEYELNICMYQVRALQRRSWVARVQKPGLKAGIPIERMAEMEKYIDTSPNSDLLWRAFYDHRENAVSVDDVVAQYEVSRKDLDYLVSVLGDSDLKYCKSPADSPLVVRKKRKVRKLKATKTQGTSMLKNTSSTTEFGSLLKSIDQSHLGLARTFCSYVVGLMTKKDLTAACQEAKAQGLSPDTLRKVVAAAKGLDRKSLSQAYESYSRTVGMSASSASKKANVSPPEFRDILHYKPLAYTCWPS